MILGVLLVDCLPADACQLAKVEAEQVTVGPWGAVVNDKTARSGKAVRWNGFVVAGNKDGAKNCISELASAAVELGFCVPPLAWKYWNMGPGLQVLNTWIRITARSGRRRPLRSAPTTSSTWPGR